MKALLRVKRFFLLLGGEFSLVGIHFQRPERRVGQCGDATRAPTQGPDQAEGGVPILSSPKVKRNQKMNLGRQDRVQSQGFGGSAPNSNKFSFLIGQGRPKQVLRRYSDPSPLSYRSHTIRHELRHDFDSAGRVSHSRSGLKGHGAVALTRASTKERAAYSAAPDKPLAYSASNRRLRPDGGPRPSPPCRAFWCAV